MSEAKIKRILRRHGVPTFPRPKGIPKNYRVKLSKKSGGIKYVHPKNEQTYVRVMPGNPNSRNLQQQKPYVVEMKNGKTLDKKGNIVDSLSPEAHIPLEEFIYKN